MSAIRTLARRSRTAAVIFCVAFTASNFATTFKRLRAEREEQKRLGERFSANAHDHAAGFLGMHQHGGNPNPFLRPDHDDVWLSVGAPDSDSLDALTGGTLGRLAAMGALGSRIRRPYRAAPDWTLRTHEEDRPDLTDVGFGDLTFSDGMPDPVGDHTYGPHYHG